MKTPAQENNRVNRVNRRAFVKTAALAGAGLALGPALARAFGKDDSSPAGTATAKTVNTKLPTVNRGGTAAAPNILMLAADDLRAWLHCLGCAQVKTPNLDRLAAMGMLFTRSYCPAPLCNPSRTALFTGRRPGATGIYGNSGDWRSNEVTRDFPSLIGWLREHGYQTFGAGKIFHEIFTKLSEWDDYGGTGLNAQKPLPSPAPDGDGVLDITFRPLIGEDKDMVDSNAVDYCIAKLRTMPATNEKPFLLGCGFHKPHLSLEVPQKYFDMYPLDQIELPQVQPTLDGLPPAGARVAREGGEYEPMIKSGRWKEAVRAYLACITFIDTQIGRLLDALENSACKDNTIILFWTDHGWHLGEKQHWKKLTLWEEATRTPLIWVVPGVTPPGSACARTVDHMGISDALRTCRRACADAHRRRKLRLVAEKSGGRVESSGGDDEQTKQPRGAHGKMALHPLCRWRRGTLRSRSRPLGMEKPRRRPALRLGEGRPEAMAPENQPPHQHHLRAKQARQRQARRGGGVTKYFNPKTAIGI